MCELGEKRIDQLESDLNRVCIQQDALMPLLQMIEYISSIQKADQNVKLVQKKLESNEFKAARLERCVERKAKEIEVPKKQLEYCDVEQKVQDLEQNLNCLYRWYETKLKEGSLQVVRTIDDKLNLDPNSEFHEQLLSVVDQTMKQAIQKMNEDFMGQLQEIKDMLY